MLQNFLIFNIFILFLVQIESIQVYSRLAKELLLQQMFDEKANLVILNEQYTKLTSAEWHVNASGTIAMWAKGSQRIEVTKQKADTKSCEKRALST